MDVVLNAEQLRDLAEAIYRKEVEAIRGIRISSEQEEEYLTDCRETYEAGLDLLESGDQLRQQFQGDNVKAPIAHKIFSFLESGVNTALQCMRNYKIRMSYITKIREHANEMMSCLRKFHRADVAAAERLAESAKAFKRFVSEQHEIMQSPASQAFSKMLHRSGTTFRQLINTHQQLFPELQGQEFQRLSDNQKIKVYESIIKASGQGSSFGNLKSMVLGHAGTAFLLFTAGITVWDIFSSHNVVETALSNVIHIGAAVGGAMLGQAIGVGVAGILTDSAVCALMAAIVTGFGTAFVLGMFASWFVETFITSGGYPVIEPTQHRYYVVEIPDYVALAREIEYRSL